MVSADTLAGKTKVEIRDAIIPICQEQIDKYDKGELTNDEFKATRFDLVGRSGLYANVPMVVTKGFAKGFTMEMHKKFREDPGSYIK